jgi:glutamyl-tRNA reductase
MKILCIGLNHETAPVSVREKLAMDENARAAALRWLMDQAGVGEALVLSTCNRVEFYLIVDEHAFSGEEVVKNLFGQHFGMRDGGWEGSLYRYSFHKAITHLFSVVSGMDSMVVGEPQITGQVKDAYRQAVQQKAVGTLLNRLLHKSFTVSKRVRTETELASRAVSVSYVAVELARKIFGDLNERAAMLAGAGEMAELAALHLTSNGVERMLVASRTLENARKLADNFRGEAVTLDSIPHHLAGIDILICSTAAPDYILRADQVREALRARKYNPIFIIDISVPRNIDPRVDDLENVYLYDMDDLQKVLKTNLEQRKKELKKAQVIVQDEVRQFLHWLNTLDLVPTIVSLRDRAEKIRRQELEKAFSMLKTSIGPEQKETIEAMSQAIVNKLLHDPITEMKRLERHGDSAGLVNMVRQLFSLKPDEG